MKTALFFMAVFFVLLTSPVLAVTETSGDLQVTYDEPLFPPSIVWYPGLTVSKSFTVKNLGGSLRKSSIKAGNTSQTGNFAGNLLFKVDEGSVYYFGGQDDKTMADFWNAGELNLSDVIPSASNLYTVTIMMPEELGSDFQGKTASFDLIVKFAGTDSQLSIGGVVNKPVNQENSTITISPSPTSVRALGLLEEVLGTATPSATHSTGQIQGEKTALKPPLSPLLLLIPLSLPLLFFLIRLLIMKK